MYEKIITLIKKRGMSLNVFEKTLGLSHGTISHWKTHTPKADSLYRVAKFLRKPMEWFMNND